jgi:hypothetical protein
LAGVVARRLAINEHVANLAPEACSDPLSFLSDKDLVTFRVADNESVILKATDAHQPQVPLDDLIVDPNL